MRSNGLSVKFIGLTSLFSQRQHSTPLQSVIKELPAFLRPCSVQLLHFGAIAELEPECQAGCITFAVVFRIQYPLAVGPVLDAVQMQQPIEHLCSAAVLFGDQLLMDLHTLNKFLTIKDKHILLYEHNAFTSHLMLESDEVYQMTKRGLDAAQISAAKRIHLNLVLVKLLELHHLGYDLRHYHAQHHAFIKQFNLPAHFQFDVAAG